MPMMVILAFAVSWVFLGAVSVVGLALYTWAEHPKEFDLSLKILAGSLTLAPLHTSVYLIVVLAVSVVLWPIVIICRPLDLITHLAMTTPINRARKDLK